MKISKVKKLSVEERFFYWITERHKIYLRKNKGKPKPWTKDTIFQQAFFTSPYRENDKTTIWFRENVRDPLKNSNKVVFATIFFRWFNLISTGELLITPKLKTSLLCNWDEKIAIERLTQANLSGPIFTGAFFISSEPGMSRIECICKILSKINNSGLLLKAANWATLEQAHADLMVYPRLGKFMAYEIVCDLRYTKFLKHATDKSTWCNAGPGSTRGLLRVLERPFDKSTNSTTLTRPKDFEEQIVKLLKKTRKTLSHLPRLELREIEHSLCEFDKYERVLHKQGKSKRVYRGEK